MTVSSYVDADVSSRELVRTLRTGAAGVREMMPENVAWHTYHELSRRGVPEADRLFVSALRRLHSRRSVAGSSLPTHDADTDEHNLTEDRMLAELWRAYKKCIRNQRTGPAISLLKEIEERLLT